MKYCHKCQSLKDIDQFYPKRTSKDGRQSQCKLCQRQYSRSHYLAARQNTDLESPTKLRTKENRKLIYDYLMSHPCVDCGEKDPIVLEFDHVDENNKYKSVSKLRTSTWKVIQVEIAKCEVRCANCHKRRTAKQFGWYKLNRMNIDADLV